MSRFIGATLTMVLCLMAAAAAPAWAFWSTDGTALCTATGDQTQPTVVSDGSGGAIVTWYDHRSGNNDIYVQKVNASGAVQWTADGVALCTATGNQMFPTIVPDGAGGAIVTWHDYRNGNNDIYVQRVNASGAVQWTADGVALCLAAGDQTYPVIAPDGSGGAVVMWCDNRGANQDVYAQRVNASGTVQWATNGVAVCSATGHQYSYAIIPDGSGGAIVTWYDYRNGNPDIYIQRVSASGAIHWTANGVALCSAAGNQDYPTIISDGSGGAIVTWHDNRNSNYDIYAQRVNASGAVQWTGNGVALCLAAGAQQYPTIVPDASGGAIVTWQDGRNGTNFDIYVQRVNASGAVQWAADGVALSLATSNQQYPMIASDGSGGAIVTWHDYRSGSSDVYAQRVNSSGAAQWTTDGVAISSAPSNQIYPAIVADGAGGAIVTWYDNRTGNNDIYAQSVDAQGKTGYLAPAICDVRDVPGDQGGETYLSWYGARSDVFMTGDVTAYTIWRAIDPARGALMLEGDINVLEDLSMSDFSGGNQVIRMERAAGLTYFWELVETVDALYMEAYGKPVATLFDSTAACTEYHYFQVVAHTADPRVFWKSEPDSGYSVDNLAPSAPIFLASSATAGETRVRWRPNGEPDLAQYRLYGGSSADIVPGPANLLAAQPDTGYTVNGQSPSTWYKLTAVDAHGNESLVSTLSPQDITGTPEEETPARLALAAAMPNPFNPRTTMRYSLSQPSLIRLSIYDLQGRLVRRLVDDARAAGEWSAEWDGRDGLGQAVASGTYVVRLVTEHGVRTGKVLLAK